MTAPGHKPLAITYGPKTVDSAPLSLARQDQRLSAAKNYRQNWRGSDRFMTSPFCRKNDPFCGSLGPVAKCLIFHILD
jgi:hypothetical protein